MAIRIRVNFVSVHFLPSRQEEFINNTHNCGVDVGLSSVWLGELHRLVTTYDILKKAGYKADDVSSNRALIELLSDNCRITRNNQETTTDEAMFIRVQDQASMTITQKQGVKFVRRILLLTWDSLLEALRVPIESPLIGTGIVRKTLKLLHKNYPFIHKINGLYIYIYMSYI